MHRRIQDGSSQGTISFHHLPCDVPERDSANNACNAMARIELVDYYGKVFTTYVPQ